MDLSLFSLTTFKFFHLLLLASTIFTTSHRRKEVKWWFSYNRLDQSSWLGKRAWWMSYSPGPLSHTALGYFNSSGGWCYLRICIFCVPSGPIVRPAGKKTPSAPDGESVTGHIPNEAFSIPPQSWTVSVTLSLPSDPLSHFVLVSSPIPSNTYTAHNCFIVKPSWTGKGLRVSKALKIHDRQRKKQKSWGRKRKA